MKYALIATACLICHITSSYAQKYIITASKYVRPNQQYALNVYFLEGNQAVQIKAMITGYEYTGGTRESIVFGQAEASFQPGREGLLNMPIGSLSGDRYYSTMLNVEASGGVVFNTSKSVQITKKTKSLFIQTDKNLYKPGQTIQFRVMAVGPNLRPVTQPMNIEVMDSKENKIRSWKDYQTAISQQYGVVNFSIPLSKQPNMGKWKIKVKCGNEEIEKQIEVAEYVLPKFEVTIDAEKSYLFRGMPFMAAVVAKYTYGQPVKGNATVVITVDYNQHRNYGVRKGDSKIVKMIELKDGRGEFRVTEAELLNMKFAPERCINLPMQERNSCHRSAYQGAFYMPRTTITVRANVTERLTGKTLSGESGTLVVTNSMKMEIPSFTPSTFKAGQPYVAFVKVTDINGGPPPAAVLAKDPKVKLKATATLKDPPTPAPPPSTPGAPGPSGPSGPGSRIAYPYPPYIPPVTREIMIGEYSIDPSGIIRANFVVPDNVKSFNLIANVTDPEAAAESKKYVTANKYNIKLFEAKKPGASIVLSIDSQTGTVKPNDNIKFIIRATEPIPAKFTMTMLSKGLLAMTKEYQTSSTLRPASSSDNEYFYDVYIDFTPDLVQKLAPSARVLVYYITTTDELIADTIDINVEGAMRNQVEVKMTPNVTLPSGDVSIDVMASPNSFIAFKAVDTSTILLGGESGPDSDAVIKELKEYDPSSSYITPYPYFRGFIDRKKRSSFCWGCWWPPSVGGSDTTQLLDRAGLIFISDVYIHVKEVERMLSSRRYKGRVYAAAPAAEGGMRQSANEMDVDNDGVVMQESVINTESNDKKTVKLRTEFPETWIWTHDITSDGTTTLNVKAPDTITSYVLTTFAMSPIDGLGIAEDAEITVFKPFFVSLNLPYSVIRGEEFELSITVFNYMKTAQEVKVTVSNQDKYMKMYQNNAEGEAPTDEDVIRNDRIPPFDGVTLKVWVRPTKLGQIPIRVTARGSSSADAVQRMLLVEAEGAEETGAASLIVNSTGDGQTRARLSADIPWGQSFLVAGSEFIKVTAIADIMGQSMANLEHLVKQPYGCGEQNMVNFAPNIDVRNYLVATDRLEENIREKTTKFMQSGYERELTYKRNDCSYSAFGQSDPAGSTWLTAFVVKSFARARTYIDIDPQVRTCSINFLAKQQTRDGDFREDGSTHNSRLVGGASKNGKVSLTAYALIAMMDNSDLLTEPRSVAAMNNAQTYLEDNIDDNIKDNSYTLAIVSYALRKRGSNQASRVMRMLMDKAVREDGSMHWEDGRSKEPKPSSRGWSRHYRPPAADTEMTAYALLALLQDNNQEYPTQVMSWLVKQQSELGGFSSTQDTVIGLEALAEYATKYYGNLNCVSDQLRITVIPDSQMSSSPLEFPVIRSGGSVLYSVEPPKDTKSVEIVTEGCGFALVQLQYQYNVKEVDDDKVLELDVTNELSDDFKFVDLEICAKWLKEDEESDMVLMEISLLSGYEAVDPQDLIRVYGSKGLKRVEEEAGKLILYWDGIPPKTPLCTKIKEERVNPVSNMQDSKIVVYPYYKTEQSKTMFYLPSALRSVDRCLVSPGLCGLEQPPVDPGNGGTGNGGPVGGVATIHNTSFLALLLALSVVLLRLA